MLSQSLIKFENLNELIQTLEDYIEMHNSAIARYGDTLGGLLRSPSSNRKVLFDQGSDQELVQQPPVNARNSKKRQDNLDGEGWLVLEAEDYVLKLASGNAASISSKQSATMFKIVEALKAKVVLLQSAQKVISSLPAEGFKPDQAFVTFFRDGVPRQIIPIDEPVIQKRRFRYSEGFQIRVLT